MDEKSQKISFDSAVGMLQTVTLLWMMEHDFVGETELKTASEWAKGFCVELNKAAELGPDAHAEYMHRVLEKVAPGINFIEKYNKITAGGRN